MSTAQVIHLAQPELHEPLISSEVDLHDFPGMMIDIHRLKKSKSWLVAKRNPALAFYLVNLWTRAWHEKPAGSIENDDDVLADAAGCDLRTWLAVKTDVMRSWRLCTDGRWYNPTVCEKAKAAWEERLKYRNRSQKGHEARWGIRKKSGDASSMHGACEGIGKGKDSGASPRPSARGALFGDGVQKVIQMSGRQEKSAKSYIGLLLSTMKDDAAFVLSVINEAYGLWITPDTELADPCAWITDKVKARASELGYPIPRGRGRPPKENQATEQINGVLDMMCGGSGGGSDWDDRPIIEHGEG